MIVFSGKKSVELAREVASGIGAQVGDIENKRFPDGELYARILSKVENEEAVYIHTTQDSDDLIELFLVLSAFRENKLKKLTCIIPYLIYSRQDEAFLEGEAVSAKTVLKILDPYADEIITINAHFLDEGGKFEFGGVMIRNLDAFPLLAKHFEHVKDPVVIAPDEGSLYYAKEAANVLNCDSDFLIKKRISGEEVEMQPKTLDIHGKNAIILDDIVSTGGTMIEASKRLKEHGALGVYLGCVHGVFAKGTEMFKELEEIVCTNTIKTKTSKVSVAPLIIDYLKP